MDAKEYDEIIAAKDAEIDELASAAPSWRPATTLPDSDTTVLLFDIEASEPVWPGYFDGSLGIWYYIDGIAAFPTHWCDFPSGPTK